MKKNMTALTVLLIAILGLMASCDPAVVAAAGGEPMDGVTVYVAPGGDDDNSGLTEETPVATLHRAVELCEEYEIGELKAAAGDYDLGGETLVISRYPLTLTGGYDPSDWETPGVGATSLINADNLLSLEGTSGFHLSHLTLNPNVNSNGFSRGIVFSAATALVENVTVEPPAALVNAYDSYESMAFYLQSSVVLKDCLLRGGRTDRHQNGFHAMQGSYVILENTLVTTGTSGDDAAVSDDAGANGIHITGNSTVEVRSSVITTADTAGNNRAVSVGDTSQLTIGNSELNPGASANGESSAIHLYDASWLIEENTNTINGYLSDVRDFHDFGDDHKGEISTVYVAPTGDDANGGFSPEEAVATLGRGLSLCREYGAWEMKVAGGDYDLAGESLNLFDMPGHIAGGYSPADWETPDSAANPTLIWGAPTVLVLGGSSPHYLSGLILEPAYSADEPSAGVVCHSSRAWLNDISVVPQADGAYDSFNALNVMESSTVTLENSSLTTGNTLNGQEGIAVAENSYLRLNNTHIATGDAGFDSDSDGTIDGGNDDSAIRGIHLMGNSRVEIYDGSLTTGTAWQMNSAIHGRDSSTLSIHGLTLSAGPSLTGSSRGLHGDGFADFMVGDSSLEGGESPWESSGVWMFDQSRLEISGSTVSGGATAGTNGNSVGIGLSQSAFGRIVENVSISGGTSPMGRQAGIAVMEEASGALIGDNLLITGGIPGETDTTGVFIQGTSGNVELWNNHIRGNATGTVSLRSRSLQADFTGALTARNNLFYAGDSRMESINIAVGNGGSLILEGNEFHGGFVDPQPTDAYAESGNLRMKSRSAENMQIVNNLFYGGGAVRRESIQYPLVFNVRAELGKYLFSRNTFHYGSLDNRIDDGWNGNVTVVQTGGDIFFDSNRILPSDPTGTDAQSRGVFLRAFQGMGKLIALNNLISLYNRNGPLHVLEPEDLARYYLSHNTLVLQNDDPTYDENLISPHYFSETEILNSLVYFPNANMSGIDSFNGAGIRLADTHLINFDGFLTTLVMDESENVLMEGSSTSSIYLAETFVNADNDLSDGDDGDWHLLDTALARDGANALFPGQNFIVSWDFDGNGRQWRDGMDELLNGLDTGAFEYVF